DLFKRSAFKFLCFFACYRIIMRKKTFWQSDWEVVEHDCNNIRCSKGSERFNGDCIPCREREPECKTCHTQKSTEYDSRTGISAKRRCTRAGKQENNNGGCHYTGYFEYLFCRTGPRH